MQVSDDVFATSEVIEGVQALEDRAYDDDGPVETDDHVPVQIIKSVK